MALTGTYHNELVDEAGVEAGLHAYVEHKVMATDMVSDTVDHEFLGEWTISCRSEV